VQSHISGYDATLKRLNSETEKAQAAFKKLTEDVQTLKRNLSETSPIGVMLNNKFGEFAYIPKLLMDRFVKIFDEFMKIAMAGIQSSVKLGISATEGVELEGRNRFNSFISMFTLDPSKMVPPEQLAELSSATIQTFAGLREGTQISSEGMTTFVKDLKTGFKSEFVPTQESLRALATVGATTTEEFTAFREASGRASMSSGQFAQLVNKNSLSFLLFGNSFAKAAADAERLGISLSSVQKGQETYVTNLDGAIDTIAQLNQMGATVDFATLTQLAEFGSPDQVISYIKSNIPSGMFGSASLRALVGQLFPGIDAETLLKLNKTGSALDELEGKLTENADGTNAGTNTLTALAQTGNILKGTFGGLITATVAAAASLYVLSAASKAGTLAQLTGGGLLKGSLATLGIGTAITGIGAGIGGGLMAGQAAGVSIGGSLVGTGLGLAAGLAALQFFPGIGQLASLAILAGMGTLGGGVGGFATRNFATRNDATFESGYGARVVFDTESKGVTAVSNNDKLVAIKAGSPPTTSSDMMPAVSKLLAKHDEILNAMNRQVPIEVDGTVTMVPATKALAGIRFRSNTAMT